MKRSVLVESPAEPPFRRLAHRIGRRGCFLLFLALVDVLIAYSMTPFTAVAQLPLYRHFTEYLPLQVWAAIWTAVGLTCAVQAFAHRDHFAFALASALKFTWAALYLSAWTIDDIPRGWVGAVIWIGFGGVTAIIASWPESRSLMLAAVAAGQPDEHDGDQ
jgi:hypothetical protein